MNTQGCIPECVSREVVESLRSRVNAILCNISAIRRDKGDLMAEITQAISRESQLGQASDLRDQLIRMHHQLEQIIV